MLSFFFFQAEDGIRDAQESRGLGDVYKRQSARIFLSNKKKPYNNKAFNLFREYALKKFNDGYDVVVLGHSHMADKFEHQSGGGIKQYFNTGDIIRHCSYVEYNSATGFELKRYNI